MSALLCSLLIVSLKMMGRYRLSTKELERLSLCCDSL